MRWENGCIKTYSDEVFKRCSKWNLAAWMFSLILASPSSCSIDLQRFPICGTLDPLMFSSLGTCIVPHACIHLRNPFIHSIQKKKKSFKEKCTGKKHMKTQVSCIAYLKKSLDHPWYPTLTRLSTVGDLRVSFLEETRKIFIPLSLMSWKSLNV